MADQCLGHKAKEIEVSWVHLPSCHTVEAENLGAVVKMDSIHGNRVTTYPCKTPRDLLALPPLNFEVGRLKETMTSIKTASQNGKMVVYNVTGPITLGTALMKEVDFYKAILKNDGNSENVIEKLEGWIVEVSIKALENGADILSLADPVASLETMGQRLYKNVIGPSNIRILKNIAARHRGVQIQLCNKMSRSLEAVGLLDVMEDTIEISWYHEWLKREITSSNETRFFCHGCLSGQYQTQKVYHGLLK